MDNADVAVVPPKPNASEVAFLETARRDLNDSINPAATDQEIARVITLMVPSRRELSLEDDRDRRLWLARCGITGNSNAEFSEKNAHKYYPILNFQAANPAVWRNPAHGILHSCVQIAFGEQLRGGGNDDERAFTSSMLSSLTSGVKEVMKEVQMARTSLPPGLHMDLTTLDMQGRRDELDSDLALVVGLRINGKSMYRACVLQAKWRPRHGGDIGLREGEQLEGVLSTGMGFYVFYPNPNSDRFDEFRFASVLPARAVFEQVWRNKGPDYRNVNTLLHGTEAAIDFPTFVSRYMTSDDLSLGRLFSSPEHVADALRGKRKLPICRHILLADTTTDMLIAKFVAAYRRPNRPKRPAEYDMNPEPKTRRRKDPASPGPSNRSGPGSRG